MPELHPGIYEHFKGKLYLVLGYADHSGTRERLVVYVPLYGHSGAPMAVRPVDSFFGKVEKDGRMVSRFEYVGDSATEF